MNNRKRSVLIWTVITIVYVIATFALSSVAEAGLFRDLKTIIRIRLDWFLHGLEYAIFSALTLRLGRVARPKLSIKALLAFVLSASLTLGILNELWQIRIPRRSFELTDIAANMTGTIIVLTLYVGTVGLTTNYFRRKDVSRVE